MGYFVRVSGLVLLGLLVGGAGFCRSDVAIAQTVNVEKGDIQRRGDADQLIEQVNQ
jgi:hypothetical protein